jgi:hypothetical protein
VSFAVVVGFLNTLSLLVFGVNEQRWAILAHWVLQQ